MTAKRSGLLAIGFAIVLAAPAAGQAGGSRSAYSYVREVSGGVTVISRWNGEVQASRNLPISAGDEIEVSETGRVEIGLADGNVLYLGGGSRASMASIRDQQGEEDAVSLVRLEDGSLILAAVGAEQSIPRVDTEDATIYVKPGARARVNYDSNRGTVVVARAGTAEVRTREGTYRVRAGEYLTVHGDEEPQTERGEFSRDRFDLWASDRYESVFQARSASANYVDEDYSSDVVALDGYGDWSYNDAYSSYVWRPRVAAGWSPYGSGSWYYTPAGLTWWSYDPWGWYPFHYGNWFFDASWGSWCWSPAYVYSPAWVYWGYGSSYVGWCPVGWYGFYSPWFNNYFKRWGWGRAGIAFSINGRFSTRTVDFRGWNFVGSRGLGAGGRMDVIPGSRIGGRLGDAVSISSRPIVVTARPGEARQAIQSYVREAPRVIERAATADSTRLAPLLARERTLPAATLEAMRGRAVIAERGRLAGPGAADIAPRGAIVDRSRTLEMRGTGPAGAATTSRIDRGGASRGAREAPSAGTADPGIARIAPNRVEPRTVIRGDERGVEARPDSRQQARDDWRGTSRARDLRPSEPRDASPDRGTRGIERRREASPPSRGSVVQQDGWRGRSRTADRPGTQPPMTQRSPEDWRSRPSLPPARRVIEGSVPGRGAPAADGGSVRRFEPRSEPRNLQTYRPRDYQPRDYRPDRAAPRQAAPASRMEPRRDTPQPRSEVQRAAPSRPAAPAAPRSAPPPPHRGSD